MTSPWCILRTSASRTLPLRKALAEAGFEVWTPTEESVKREGPQRKRILEDAPITPRFVFARYDRVCELATLSRAQSQTYQVWDADLRRMVIKGFPHFTVFRSNGAYDRVADRALDPLRVVEQRCKPKDKVREFAVGEEVGYPEAGFQGLPGTVEGTKGKYVLVTFEGLPITVQIEARSLAAYARAD
jgi:transcription antitermination factor NusG